MVVTGPPVARAAEAVARPAEAVARAAEREARCDLCLHTFILIVGIQPTGMMSAIVNTAIKYHHQELNE